jgi:predicted transcriptional regulator
MNLVDYYRIRAAEIKEEDVSFVAHLMSNHIGEQNAITIRELQKKTGFHERKVRDILQILVLEHEWLIGSHAGKAGRWIIYNEEERWHVANELRSREQEIKARRWVIERAPLPAKLELSGPPQSGLF